MLERDTSFFKLVYAHSQALGFAGCIQQTIWLADIVWHGGLTMGRKLAHIHCIFSGKQHIQRLLICKDLWPGWLLGLQRKPISMIVVYMQQSGSEQFLRWLTLTKRPTTTCRS